MIISTTTITRRFPQGQAIMKWSKKCCSTYLDNLPLVLVPLEIVDLGGPRCWLTSNRCILASPSVLILWLMVQCWITWMTGTEQTERLLESMAMRMYIGWFHEFTEWLVYPVSKLVDGSLTFALKELSHNLSISTFMAPNGIRTTQLDILKHSVYERTQPLSKQVHRKVDNLKSTWS